MHEFNFNPSSFFLFLSISFLPLAQAASHLPSTPFPQIYISGRTYDPNAVLKTPAGAGKTYYVDGANGSDAFAGLSAAGSGRFSV